MHIMCRGEEAKLGYVGGGGGRGVRSEILLGFSQYTLLQNKDNSGLLGTPVYYALLVHACVDLSSMWIVKTVV